MEVSFSSSLKSKANEEEEANLSPLNNGVVKAPGVPLNEALFPNVETIDSKIVSFFLLIHGPPPVPTEYLKFKTISKKELLRILFFL